MLKNSKSRPGVLLTICAACLFLGGCAANGGAGRAALTSEHSKALMWAFAECISESSIEIALWSDDVNAIVAGTHKFCARKKRALYDSYPPELRYDAQLEAAYGQIIEDTAVSTLARLWNKKKVLDQFFDCASDNTLNRAIKEDVALLEEFERISLDETAMCYDKILSPYIGAGNNEYTRNRKNVFVESTSKIHMKTAQELSQKPGKGKIRQSEEPGRLRELGKGNGRPSS